MWRCNCFVLCVPPAFYSCVSDMAFAEHAGFYVWSVQSGRKNARPCPVLYYVQLFPVGNGIAGKRPGISSVDPSAYTKRTHHTIYSIQHLLFLDVLQIGRAHV